MRARERERRRGREKKFKSCTKNIRGDSRSDKGEGIVTSILADIMGVSLFLEGQTRSGRDHNTFHLQSLK